MNGYVFVMALLISIVILMCLYNNSKYYINIHTGTRYKIVKEGYAKAIDTHKYEYYYILKDGNGTEMCVFINELKRNFVKVIF